MDKEFKNFAQLTKHFNNELTCAVFLEEQRWSGKPLCPHCGSEHHSRTQTRFKHVELKDYKDFRCKACDKKYTVLTGTVYESSKINLTIWFQALYLISAHKKGISSLQLASDLGVTQKTAWFMLHRIREMLREKAPVVLEGVVSADEIYIGGKTDNKHLNKRSVNNDDRSRKDKTPVIGIMQQHGKITTIVMDQQANSKTIRPIILSNVKPGSTLVTDASRIYHNLGSHYNTFVVNHKKDEFITPEGYSTNNVENFWSLLKRGITGIYHYVSPKHLHRYCDEFGYRFNNRKLTDIEKFGEAMKKCNDTRLQYKVLTS